MGPACPPLCSCDEGTAIAELCKLLLVSSALLQSASLPDPATSVGSCESEALHSQEKEHGAGGVRSPNMITIRGCHDAVVEARGNGDAALVSGSVALGGISGGASCRYGMQT